MSKIFISDMEFFAFHGHYAEEKLAGNKFIVDVEMDTNTEPAQKSDNLNDALNYQTAYSIIREVITGTKSNLLENIAENVLNALFSEFDNLESAKIKICKVNPPMGGQIGTVGVEIFKSKNDL
ncbi:MAG TPA: dihydroneopterin aldolase [Bacteroidales bacterium]|nr:dihydroneopterin aldolase [Bacteroidales bacterium]